MKTQLNTTVNEVISKESQMFCEMHNLTLLPVEGINEWYVVGNNSSMLDIKAEVDDTNVEVEFKTVLVDKITPASYNILMTIIGDSEFRNFVRSEDVYFDNDKIFLEKTINIEAGSEETISINYLVALTNLIAISKFLCNYIDEKFAEQLQIMAN